MFEKIKEIFEEYTFLNPKDIFQLATLFELKHISKGEHLVREGELNFKGVIVIKGLLSHYVIDQNGDEKTLLLVPEGRFSGSLQTNLNKKPSDENIIALENCLVATCDFRKIEILAADNIRISKMINQQYKLIILDAATRIKYLIGYSPEERYLNFIKFHPNLENRVKQKDLASYLGITISSLSRIKARILKN